MKSCCSSDAHREAKWELLSQQWPTITAMRTDVTSRSARRCCTTCLFITTDETIVFQLICSSPTTTNKQPVLTRQQGPRLTTNHFQMAHQVQGWGSGDSTRHPLMSGPGFDSQTRRHMWVDLLVLYSAPGGVYPRGLPYETDGDARRLA